MGLDDLAAVEKWGGGRKEQRRVRGQKSKGEKEGREYRVTYEHRDHPW